MNWFATVIFAILEVALRSLRNAYTFVSNSRKIGPLADLGKLATSRARPCLAVALSILLIMCFFSLVTTVQASPADPGHAASRISAGTFESGYFIFPNNLSVTQNFTVDSTTLYVDSLNNRIGIGTTSPTAKLEISFGDEGRTIIRGNPAGALGLSSSANSIQIIGGNDTIGQDAVLLLRNEQSNADWGIYQDSANDYLKIQKDQVSPFVTIDNFGNVGINTTNPQDKLTVIGTLNATNIQLVPNCADGDILKWSGGVGTCGTDENSGGNVTGNGGNNIIPKWTGQFTLGNSSITDDGSVTVNNSLDVVSTTGSSYLFVDQSDGDVGINTTGPDAKLHVRGGACIDTDDACTDPGAGNLNVAGNITFAYGSQIKSGTTTYPTVLSSGWDSGESQDFVRFYTSGNGAGNANPKITILSGGNVGIGTTGPGAKLDLWDGEFYLSDADVTHGLTMLLPTNVYARLMSIDNDGGLKLTGVSDSNGNPGLWLSGVIGVDDPNDGIPAIKLVGEKGNSMFGGTQALGASETVFQILNDATELVTVLGSSNVGIGTTTPQQKLDVVGNINSTGYINSTTDVCVEGGNCLSGSGGGDLTAVLQGWGINVTNSGGPTPRVNLSSFAAGDGLTYSVGVINVNTGVGLGTSGDAVVVNAGAGLGTSGNDVVVNTGNGVQISSDTVVLNQSCSDEQILKWNDTESAWVCADDFGGTGDLTDVLEGWGITVTNPDGPSPRVNLSSGSAGDGLAYSQGILSVNAGDGLGTNGDNVIVNTGNGVEISSDTVVLNQSCSNGEVLKWNSTTTYWECEQDEGLGSEVDTLQSVTSRGATTTDNVTIDSNSDALTNIANTLYVNGSVDMVGIGTANPSAKLDVNGLIAGQMNIPFYQISGIHILGNEFSNELADWEDRGYTLEVIETNCAVTGDGTSLVDSESYTTTISVSSTPASLVLNFTGKTFDTMSHAYWAPYVIGRSGAAPSAIKVELLNTDGVNWDVFVDDTSPTWANGMWYYDGVYAGYPPKGVRFTINYSSTGNTYLSEVGLYHKNMPLGKYVVPRLHKNNDFTGENTFAGKVGINDTSPDASLEIVNDGSGDSFLVADNGDGDSTPFVIQSDGDVGIGTTSPGSKLDVVVGANDGIIQIRGKADNSVNSQLAYNNGYGGYLSMDDEAGNVDVLLRTYGDSYFNGGSVGIGTTTPQQKLDVVGNINSTGYINTTGADVCIEGGNCLSKMGAGTGDLTDVLAGWGITVTNSGGPQPRVNLSSGSAGDGLAYLQGVLSVNAGDGLTTSGDNVLVNEGTGLEITSDVLHFDCSDVTDVSNDGITCSNEDLFVGAGNGLSANATALEIDLYTGSGMISDGTGLSMNRSCGNGEVLKWESSGSRWYCAQDSGIGGEVDTLQTVTARGNTTTQPVTIDSDSNELTNIANTFYVNGANDRVSIGKANPAYKFDVESASAGVIAHFQHNTGTRNQGLYISVNASVSPYVTNLYSSGTSAGDLAFYTGATEKVRIDTSGKVGIGTTSPNRELEVVGDANVSGALNVGNWLQLGGANAFSKNADWLYIGDGSSFSTGIYARVKYQVADGYTVEPYTDGGADLGTSSKYFGSTYTDSLYTTGNVGIGDISPDARLEVLSNSGSQLVLTHTDNVDYANFTVDSDGNLTISSSSGNVIIQLG